MYILKYLALLLLAIFTPFNLAWAQQQKVFIGEGSDTLMGVGGKYIALAGAGAAISDDVFALYFNPAGLAKIEGVQFSLARQVNSELLPINFAGAAVSLPMGIKLSRLVLQRIL